MLISKERSQHSQEVFQSLLYGSDAHKNSVSGIAVLNEECRAVGISSVHDPTHAAWYGISQRAIASIRGARSDDR